VLSTVALLTFIQLQHPLVCMKRPEMVYRLLSQHQESLETWGIVQDGTLVEMWVNISTGSWTLLATYNGESCIIRSGIASGIGTTRRGTL
jgi:hypothetical protein